MSVNKEYHHLIPSLEVYPRVHFFSKRYRDIKEKYKKFADKNRKTLSINHIEAPLNCIENGLIIKVIGKEDLDPAKFVATDPHLFKVLSTSTAGNRTDIKHNTIAPVNPHKDCVRTFSASGKKVTKSSDDTSASTSKEGQSEAFKSNPTTIIVICNAVVECLNDKGLEDIKLLWKRFENIKEPQLNGYFFLCRSNLAFTQNDENVFRSRLDEVFVDCLKPTHIIIRGQSDDRIGDEISLYLEEIIVQNLVTVESELQKYTTGKKGCNPNRPLLEDDLIRTAVKCFLEGIPEYGKETNPDKQHEKSRKDEDSIGVKMSELTLQDVTDKWLWKDIENDKRMTGKLALIVKCCVAIALSGRHNIILQLCNDILIRHDFEQRCLEMFSERLMYYVNRLWYCDVNRMWYCAVKKRWYFAAESQYQHLQSAAYPHVLSLIQADLLDFVTDIERGVRQFASTLRKLLFEISSCFKKTKVDIEKIKEREQAAIVSKKVVDSLRKEILSIKEVYGVGTIYGHLEIHVNENSAVERVESLIRDMLRKNNVSCPFSVRAIELKLEMLADHSFHEHGERIECETRTGTLAGFVEGSDQRLYGLTCAHVVKAEADCDVFIYDGSENRREFAKCVPHMIVSPGTSTKPLIDFAAVRVIDSVQSRCSIYLKDDDCMSKPGIIAADTTEDLAGIYVYKHGAATQLTKGLVSSDDYSVLGTDETHYVFLIENYDEDEENVFAEPGDSGSMICAPDENEVYVVKAIGVLHGRTITPIEGDTQKYFSFRLVDGLRKLTERAQGVNFNFPMCC